jgi:hypothetical protein
MSASTAGFGARRDLVCSRIVATRANLELVATHNLSLSVKLRLKPVAPQLS